jgi:hypothetical protein
LLTYTFALDAGDDAVAGLADRITINSRVFQDAAGANVPTDMQVLRVNARDGARLEYLATKDVFVGGAESGRYGLITPDSQADYTSASDAEKAKYFFITEDTGLMSNGDEGYLLI